MNNGPMTGGGRGLCTGNVAASQRLAGGYGMGRGLRRGCRDFGMGGGREMGRGGNYGHRTGPSPAVSNQTVLQNRANMLEAELAEIKNQLNKLSESGE